MRNPPRALAGLEVAQGGESDGGGGSAWRRSQACTCWRWSGLGFGCWGFYVVRRAKAHIGGVRAALQGTRHGEVAARAAAERGHAMFWPLE